MYEVIIIGAGPAGLTAGLYAGRYRLSTVLIEKMSVGGQIILSPTIENFPGFPGSIATEELIARCKKQLDEVNVPVEYDEVLSIGLDGAGFIVSAQEKNYTAKSVIIASGAQWKRLGVEGEEQFIGRGVSYCGTCDGPLFRDKEVAVVGGGDHAIEDALFLSRYAKKVTVVHRRQEFRAAKILLENARKDPKINFILDTVVEKIIGESKVERILLRNVKTNLPLELACQGVFIFVGIQPNTAFLKNQVQADGAGFIITDHRCRTTREGIFACGDCRQKSLYQVVSACGEGAVAAYEAHTYLLTKR